MAYSLEQKIPREQLAEFCRRNHIQRLSLFGSALRDQLHPDSDIDLLVEFEPDRTPGLFSIVRMEMELSDVLGRKVDMRTAEDLSRYFRDEVVRHAKLQYEV
jgi:predicted nucleotidyltransferase